MKKAIIAICLIGSIAFAHGPFEFGFSVGGMKLDKERTGISKTATAATADIKVDIPTIVPLSFDWRMYGATFRLDEKEYVVTDDNGYVYRRYHTNDDYHIAGSDMCILFHLNQFGVVDPYLGGGVAFESRNLTYHYSGYHGYHRYSYNYSDEDELGITYIARAGLLIDSGVLCLNGDVGLIGPLYDEDDSSQLFINGEASVYFIEQARVGVFFHHFSEYKSTYVGLGLTISI